MEVSSGRFREGCIRTTRGIMWRFAPNDSELHVKVACPNYLGDTGLHMKVCSGCFRKGFIWTIRGDIGRFAPDDVSKGLSGRSKEACQGLLRTIP